MFNTRGVGGVNCLDQYDINGDGTIELIVGRDDGTLDIFTYDTNEEPLLKYSTVGFLCFNLLLVFN